MKAIKHQIFSAKRSIAYPVMLSLVAVFTGLNSVSAEDNGYTYSKIAVLGQTAPGGAQYTKDFEPGQINFGGDLVFVADLGPTFDEGVFRFSHGKIFALALPGNPAHGGGTFDGFGFTPTGINDDGDAAFAEALTPFRGDLPLGTNAGLYRYSADTNAVRAVVVPGVTTVPSAGTLKGVTFGTPINNRGDICFTGLLASTVLPPPPNDKIGLGIFVADKAGRIRKVVIPGDPAPSGKGKKFDFAEVAWINNGGDVAFGAHIHDEEFVQDNVYLSKAPSFQIISIAHQGDPAPGGGTFRHAWGPILNDNQQLLFVGDLSPSSGPIDVNQGFFSILTPGVRFPWCVPAILSRMASWLRSATL